MEQEYGIRLLTRRSLLKGLSMGAIKFCWVRLHKMGRDTGKIVTFLLDRGINAMKIYPFTDGPDLPEGQFLSSDSVPVPLDGYVSHPESPGLGAEIRPEIFKEGSAIVETIAEFK